MSKKYGKAPAFIPAENRRAERNLSRSMDDYISAKRMGLQYDSPRPGSRERFEKQAESHIRGLRAIREREGDTSNIRTVFDQ